MKIRIIGTSTKKYVDNFKSIWTNDLKTIVWRQEGIKWKIFDKNHKPLLTFNSTTTLRQCLEVWEALGFIIDKGAHYEVSASSEHDELIRVARRNLLTISHNKKIQQIKNKMMLVIENYTNNISQKQIKLWEIKQTRGELTPSKLKKEESEIEVMISNNEKFIASMRGRLYAEINKEF